MCRFRNVIFVKFRLLDKYEIVTNITHKRITYIMISYLL